MKSITVLGSLALALAGCASTGQQGLRELSEGTFEIQCGSLGRCAEQAERACRNRGYDIIGGYDRSDVYGHEAGESQVAIRRSQLVVVCRTANGESRLPPEGAPLPPPPPPPSAAPSAPNLLCTPGATQRCVGKGACDGGQSCLPDGSGFGPCECAEPAPTPAAPASSAPPATEPSSF
jgi:hypothetical protein